MNLAAAAVATFPASAFTAAADPKATTFAMGEEGEEGAEYYNDNDDDDDRYRA